jgi:hypothetical protein
MPRMGTVAVDNDPNAPKAFASVLIGIKPIR